MLYDLIAGGAQGFDLRSFLIELLLNLPVFLIALSFHEAAHAWMANRCGDPTARLMGRLTLNPIKHIDPIGFLMLILIGIGYAKPVPVNPNNYRNYRRDDFLVSIAGITANLILFVIAALLMFGFNFYFLSATNSAFGANVQGVPVEYHYYILKTTSGIPTTVGYLYEMVQSLAFTNLMLACFNLLPVPPLDGYHVFNDLLFKRRLFAPEQAARIGQGLLLVLMLTGLLSKGLNFVMNGAYMGINSLMTAAFRALGMM